MATMTTRMTRTAGRKTVVGLLSGVIAAGAATAVLATHHSTQTATTTPAVQTVQGLNSDSRDGYGSITAPSVSRGLNGDSGSGYAAGAAPHRAQAGGARPMRTE